MKKLLNEQVVSQISQTFEQMKEPIQILFFGSQDNCEDTAPIRASFLKKLLPLMKN